MWQSGHRMRLTSVGGWHLIHLGSNHAKRWKKCKSAGIRCKTVQQSFFVSHKRIILMGTTLVCKTRWKGRRTEGSWHSDRRRLLGRQRPRGSSWSGVFMHLLWEGFKMNSPKGQKEKESKYTHISFAMGSNLYHLTQNKGLLLPSWW